MPAPPFVLLSTGLHPRYPCNAGGGYALRVLRWLPVCSSRASDVEHQPVAIPTSGSLLRLRVMPCPVVSVLSPLIVPASELAHNSSLHGAFMYLHKHLKLGCIPEI